MNLFLRNQKIRQNEEGKTPKKREGHSSQETNREKGRRRKGSSSNLGSLGGFDKMFQTSTAVAVDKNAKRKLRLESNPGLRDPSIQGD